MSSDGLSDELADLLDRLSGPDADRFRGFAARLAPHEPVLIEESAAGRAVRPYGWLLTRLGVDGVRLTSAGYLPYRGVLSPTKLGRALLANPLSLWWHIAERLPDARSEAEADAGLLLLVVLASGTPVNTTMLDRLLCKGMAALGWQVARTGGPLDDQQAFTAARNTWTALRRLGALPEVDWTAPTALATPAGIQLARAALLRQDRRILPASRDE